MNVLPILKVVRLIIHSFGTILNVWSLVLDLNLIGLLILDIAQPRRTNRILSLLVLDIS